MLALENESFLFFFLFLQKLEKLDWERGERVKQYALNMMCCLFRGGVWLALQDCHQDIDLCQEEHPQDLEKYPSVMTPFIFQRVGSQ